MEQPAMSIPLVGCPFKSRSAALTQVHALAVVLWELGTRLLPYSDCSWHPNELMGKVEQGYRPSPLPDVAVVRLRSRRSAWRLC